MCSETDIIDHLLTKISNSGPPNAKSRVPDQVLIGNILVIAAGSLEFPAHECR